MASCWRSARATGLVSASQHYLLDSSAVLALIEEEPGAERVAKLLRTGRAILPWIALLEVRYITLQECGAMEAERRQSYLLAIPSLVDWAVDAALLAQAAIFKAGLRLSFADSLIAAYASKHEAVLVHKDPEFDSLPPGLIREALPFKAGS